VSVSVVFGYVRLSRADPPGVRRQIGAYCAREGLALELVFADSGIGDAELVRPGWTALLDALRRTGGPVVVLPTLDHLSRDPVLRAELRTQLSAAGATVTVMSNAAAWPRQQ